MSLEIELIDIFFRYLDAGLILICIQNCLDLQSAMRSGTTDEVHHGFKVDQRLALLIQAAEGKQPVFDLVPLAGAERIMADRDRHPRFIAERR